MFWITLAVEPLGPLLTPLPPVGTLPAVLPAPLTLPARVMPGS